MKTKTCHDCANCAARTVIATCKHVGVVTGKEPACAKFEQKPMTNGDKIRAMSNEELAIEFATLTDCGNCDDCPVKDYCATDCCDPIPAWLAYLNAPAESEGTEK